MNIAEHSSKQITSWPEFARKIRVRGNLLRELFRFPDAVLVTGCQRSGTTAVSRMISASNGMRSHWVSRDDELDGALMLAGVSPHPGPGRYCFQTTYLNDSYAEYFRVADDVRIVWVLRNPYSVVYSMAYNWRRFALNELFRSCGSSCLKGRRRKLAEWLGPSAVPKIERACCAYNGKLRQLGELEKHFGPGRMMVLDYDQLVRDGDELMPELYEFIGLPFCDEYRDMIHARSLNKADRMPVAKREMIERISYPVYSDVCRRFGLASL